MLFHCLDPDFIGLVLYTSGSTGTAQAIPKKLAQLGAEVAALETQFGALLGAADITATVSHQHIYGLLFQSVVADHGRPRDPCCKFFLFRGIGRRLDAA